MEKTIKDMIEALSHGPVQRYIHDHEYDDVRNLVLKNKVLLGIPTAQLVGQIATRRKAKDKLPSYYHTEGTIFPPAGNFEQSSSESTAVFKAGLISKSLTGARDVVGADLTGGFGVDTFFFSKTFSHIHYVEPDTSLLEIARYDHQLLGASNIDYHPTTAEEFLKSTAQRFDFIYIDPSRRTEEKKKVHSLEDARPDVIRLKDTIFQKTDLLVIKASPLLDIHAGVQQLGEVEKVCVVSVNNECKELLFLCRKGFSGEPSIETENIVADARRNESFEFHFKEEREAMPAYSNPGAFLYEPNAAIMKAGAFRVVATRLGLAKIHPNTHLYTSAALVENFPGRTFRVEAFVKPERSSIKEFFPDGKANVTTRNYPLTPEALKKKTGLRDGGDRFLIGFSGREKKYLVVAERI